MKRRSALVSLLILAMLVANAAPQTAYAQQQPFPAPSLAGGSGWLNTSRPIDLRDLRGKIVLLDFWTYCCINCIHILPTLKKLEAKYPNQLVVIGVHSPKFTTEKDLGNLRQAVLRYEITHPVVSDSSKTIWRRYKINFWPSMYLIDPEGKVCAWRRGEAPFEVLDKAVAQQVRLHRQKRTLNETPIRWDLELDKQPRTALRFPGKVIVDEAGKRLVVADSGNHRLVITSPSGDTLSIVGSGRPGNTDGSLADAAFHDPQGMVLDGDTLYVADNLNHTIRKVDLKAGQVTTIAGTGRMLTSYSTLRGRSSNPTRYTLSNPWDLALVNRRLYIAMAGTHQLAVLNLDTNSIRAYAGNGVEDVKDGSLAKCCMAQPSGLATDGKYLFVVDSEGSSLRAVTLPPGNQVGTLVGTTGLPMFKSLFAFGDRDGRGSAVRLQHPIGVAYADGKIYVADTYNHKIKLVDPANRSCVTLVGDRRRGNSLQPLQLHEPAGVAVHGQTLFIADTNNHRIVTVDLASRQARELKITGLEPPPKLARVPETKVPVP